MFEVLVTTSSGAESSFSSALLRAISGFLDAPRICICFFHVEDSRPINVFTFR